MVVEGHGFDPHTQGPLRRKGAVHVSLLIRIAHKHLDGLTHTRDSKPYSRIYACNSDLACKISVRIHNVVVVVIVQKS